MKVSDVPALKVTELREALKERGLPSSGTKAVLAERLTAALEAEEKEKGAESPTDNVSSEDGAPEAKEQQAEAQAPAKTADPPLISHIDEKGNTAAEQKEFGNSKVEDKQESELAGEQQRAVKPEGLEKPEALSSVPAGSSSKQHAETSATKSEQGKEGLVAAADQDTEMPDGKPGALASHEAEHEEQVDYGTDEIIVADESPAEAKPSDKLADLPEQALQLEGRDNRTPSDDPDSKLPEPSEGGKEGASECVAGTDAGILDALGRSEAEVAGAVGAAGHVVAKEVVLEPLGGAAVPAAETQATDKQQKAAEVAKAAPADLTPQAPASGRKRQPIQFKVDEVEQRVAAKRAAREVATGEGAAGHDKLAAADKSKPLPASGKKTSSAAAAAGEATSAEAAAAVVLGPPALAQPPTTESSPAAAAPVETAAGPGGASAGRAPKLQKLDSAGRKIIGVVPASDVAARSGATAAGSAGTKGGVGATAKKPPAPPPLEGPATRALRIDGFVRPFTEHQVRQFLSDYGVIEDLWMPSIKKYCYVVFAEVAHGEAAALATNGVVWPPTNSTSILRPTYLSSEDAAAAISNGRAGLAETPRSVSAALASPKATPAALLPQAASGTRRDTLTAAVAAAAADAAAAKQKAPAPPVVAAAGNNGTTSRKRQEPEADADVAGAGAAAAAAAAPSTVAAAAAGAAPEPSPLSLDDLFKKTKSKPVIYWLPLTEQDVAAARKKRKEEEAAAQKADAEAERERARRQQDRERERDRAGDRGGLGGLPLPPPPPLPGPPPRDGRGGFERDRQGYGRERR